MNPLQAAQTLGYGKEDILKYLSKANPQIAESITKAMGLGYTAEQVMDYFSKSMAGAKVNKKISRQVFDAPGIADITNRARNAPEQGGKASQLSLVGGLAGAGAGLLTGGPIGAAIGAASGYKSMDKLVTAYQDETIRGGKVPFGEFVKNLAVGTGLAGMGAATAKPLMQAAKEYLSSMGGDGEEQSSKAPDQLQTQPPEVQQAMTTPAFGPKEAFDIVKNEGLEQMFGAIQAKTPEDMLGALKHMIGQPRLNEMAKKYGKPIEEIVGNAFMFTQAPPEPQVPSLEPQAPSLEPQAPSLEPQAPSLEPQASSPEAPITLDGMVSGMTNSLYSGIFKSLQEGKNTFAGVKDPLIAKAKPLFDQGLINSPKDLEDFANNRLKQPEPEAKPEVKPLDTKEEATKVTSKKKIPEEDQAAIAKIMEKIPTKMKTRPLTEKDVKEIKALKSSNVRGATYDKDKTLQVIFANGSAYQYNNVDKEDAHGFLTGASTTVSSGESAFRAFDDGKDTSFGSGLNTYIKKNKDKYPPVPIDRSALRDVGMINIMKADQVEKASHFFGSFLELNERAKAGQRQDKVNELTNSMKSLQDDTQLEIIYQLTQELKKESASNKASGKRGIGITSKNIAKEIEKRLKNG